MTSIAASTSAQDKSPVSIIFQDDESPATAILRHWSSEPATTKNEMLIVASSNTMETKADDMINAMTPRHRVVTESPGWLSMSRRSTSSKVESCAKNDMPPVQEIRRLEGVQVGEDVYQFGGKHRNGCHCEGESTIDESRRDGHQDSPANEVAKGHRADKAGGANRE